MSTDATHRLPVGYKLQNYRILSVLGEGGFGITYLAQDEVLEQKVAIKEYFPASLTSRNNQTQAVQASNTDSAKIFQWGLDRFLTEARILAQLSHPHIVRVLYFTSLNNTGYMVMQYEEGEPLDKWVKRYPDSQLPQADVLALLDPITQALEVVHELGIAHRDVKPANIYIRSSGQPVLLDFGAARNTVSGRSQTVAAIVSSGYSPIEQYSDVAEQGPWTDIYATAAVAYRLICGKTPPDAPSRIDAELSSRADPCAKLSDAPMDGFDPHILQGIDQALAIRAKDRPQSIKEWRAVLGLDGDSTKTAGKSAQAQPTKAGAGFAQTVLVDRPPPELDATVLARPRSETEAGSSKSGGAGIALGLIGLAAVAAAGWFGFQQLGTTTQDKIPDTYADALKLGTLTTNAKTVSDQIGGDDKKDVIRFKSDRTRLVKLDTTGVPARVELQVTKPDGTLITPLRQKDTQSYKLDEGPYAVIVSSTAGDERNYDLKLTAESLNPDTGSLIGTQRPSPVIDISGTTPIERDGIIWSDGEERTYILRNDDTTQVKLNFDSGKANAKVAIVDAAGLGVGGIEGDGKSGEMAGRLPSGDNQLVITSRQDDPLGFSFKLTPVPAPAKAFAKTVLKVAGWQSKAQAEALARNRTRLALVSNGRGITDDEATAMKALEQGISYDADWDTTWKGNEAITASLKARVRPVEKPNAIDAALSATSIKALEPFDVSITSKAGDEINVGVYAWGADSNVVRIFPIGIETDPLHIPAGGTKKLSERVDQLISAPLPGERESREAVIVVSCPKGTKADFVALAPAAGASVGQSISTAIGEESFFDKLSSFCPGNLGLRVLPYTVTATDAQ